MSTATKSIWSKAEEKAKELTASKKMKVIPFMAKDGKDEAIGYLIDLDDMTDAKLYAARVTSPEKAILMALQVLETNMLKEESDKRFAERKWRKGAALFVLSLVESAEPELKKKLEYYNEYYNDEVGTQASLIFYLQGIDHRNLDTDTFARYVAMNRRAQLFLKIIEMKTPQANTITSNA